MTELMASQPVLINRGMLYLDWNLGDPTPWGRHLASTSGASFGAHGVHRARRAVTVGSESRSAYLRPASNNRACVRSRKHVRVCDLANTCARANALRRNSDQIHSRGFLWKYTFHVDDVVADLRTPGHDFSRDPVIRVATWKLDRHCTAVKNRTSQKNIQVHFIQTKKTLVSFLRYLLRCGVCWFKKTWVRCAWKRDDCTKISEVMEVILLGNSGNNEIHVVERHCVRWVCRSWHIDNSVYTKRV